MFKISKVVLLLSFSFFSLNVQAQLKVEEKGRVVVGPDYGDNFDRDTVLSMSIQGPVTEACNAGAKLGFGDFGRILYPNSIGGWNVFIGEYGLTDSDIMWLHGKKGIRLTSGNGNEVLAEFGCDESTRSYIFGGLRTGQIMVSSEDGFKRDLTPLSSVLPRLLQLNSVSYRYVLPRDYAMTAEGRERLPSDSTRVHSTNYIALTGKDREDSVRMACKDSLRVAGTSLYGFVTSDLRRMFPELVETDSDGNSYVDYIGMIPVIVAAIGEQQREIEYLNAQLQECCRQSRDGDDAVGDDVSSRSSMRTGLAVTQYSDSNAVLYQNSPNPFDRKTEIGYYIPEQSNSATIYVFSLSGALMETFQAHEKGYGTVAIDGSALAAGMYVYTLVVDGKIIDSKRMILTN